MDNEHTEQQLPDHCRPGHHEEKKTGHNHGAAHVHGHHLVVITVDGRQLKIQPGIYLVADLKRHVGVDTSYELDEVIHGEFQPLKDDARITIKSKEIFVSHVRTGSSS